MRLLVHALSLAEVLADVPGGLRGQLLVRVDVDGLAAWATPFAEANQLFGRTDLIERHQIMSRLQAELRAGLDAVRDQCELAVTVLWTTPAEPVTPTEPTTPGTRYLRERQHALAGSDRRRERARELADETASVYWSMARGRHTPSLKSQCDPEP